MKKITPEEWLYNNTANLLHLPKKKREEELAQKIKKVQNSIHLRLEHIDFQEEWKKEVTTEKVIERLRIKNYIKKISDDDLLSWLIELYNISKWENDIIFLNYLKEIFNKLKEEEKIQILDILYNDNHIEKNIIYIFFKDIDLRKIKKVKDEIKWAKFFDKLNNKNNQLKNIEVWTNLYIIIEQIQEYKWPKDRPHKDDFLIKKLLELFDKKTLNDFIIDSEYNTFKYNITRVFLELAYKKWLFEDILNSNLWEYSRFWIQQKILEKALLLNIDLNSYPQLNSFLKQIKKLKNKSDFQKELIALYNKNSKSNPTTNSKNIITRIKKYLPKIKSIFSRLFKKLKVIF